MCIQGDPGAIGYVKDLELQGDVCLDRPRRDPQDLPDLPF